MFALQGLGNDLRTSPAGSVLPHQCKHVVTGQMKGIERKNKILICNRAECSSQATGVLHLSTYSTNKVP